MIGVQTGDAQAVIGPVLPAVGGFVGIIICSANLTDKMAIAADTQMDDGIPSTGNVRAALHAAGPNPDIGGAAGIAVSVAYAETGTNIYTLCRSL